MEYGFNHYTICPSGDKSITENGTYDVTNYANAVVNIARITPEMFGCTQMAVDTFDGPDDTSGRIQHSLGAVPRLYIVTTSNTSNEHVQYLLGYSNSSSNMWYAFMCRGNYSMSSDSFYDFSSSNAWTNTYVTFNTANSTGMDHYLRGGVTYTIITMA